MRLFRGWLAIAFSLSLLACRSSISAPPRTPAEPRKKAIPTAPRSETRKPPSPPVTSTPPQNPSNCPASGEALIVATLHGEATYYSDKFQGRRTASGEPYDTESFTAAHRTLPFGTFVRVLRQDDRTHYVCVRVTDRGPFGKRKRIIDLSKAAARRLDMLRAGVVDVQVEVLEPAEPTR